MNNLLHGWRQLRPSSATTILAGAALLAAVGLASTQGNPGAPNDPPTQVLPMSGSGATADSNGRMVAVTGVDVTGASVLYLVDTQNMRLAVYQASSTGSNQGVRFIGGRRIELDMQLDGFNDRSEYSYKDLKDEFSKKGLIDLGASNNTPPADR